MDGCAGSYWSSRGGSLLGKRAREAELTIDRGRSVAGHGKGRINGAHAVIKEEGRRRLRQKVSHGGAGSGAKVELELAEWVDGQRVPFAKSLAKVLKEGGIEELAIHPTSMSRKREKDRKMKSRFIDYFEEGDVEELDYPAFRPVDPRTAAEKKAKTPHCNWKVATPHPAPEACGSSGSSP